MGSCRRWVAAVASFGVAICSRPEPTESTGLSAAADGGFCLRSVGVKSGWVSVGEVIMVSNLLIGRRAECPTLLGAYARRVK